MAVVPPLRGRYQQFYYKTMYRLKFVGLKFKGCDPLVRTGRLNDGGVAQKEFRKLVDDALKLGTFSAFKISMNSADSRPWKNNILYSQGMSDKVSRYTIGLMAPMRKIPIESEQFTLFYFRWAGEYLDRSVTKVDNDDLTTDLILDFKRDGEKNEFVTAYVLLVLDHELGSTISHVDYKGLDILKESMPNGELGGFNWKQLENARKVLFGS